MPPKCQYCPYWEVCEYPWVCPDMEQLATDTISRQAAIDAVEFGITFAKVIDKSTRDVKELFREGNHSLTEAIKRIKNLPSAQPEIIRCRDCKHYCYADNRIPQEQWCACDISEETWQPDDFCSYGKRREDKT